MMKTRLPIIILSLLVLLNYSYAFPQMPTEFYGNVTFNSTPAPVGAVITAYGPNSTLCGNYTLIRTGYYGVMSCNADDPETQEDEGASDNQSITFMYNNMSVSTTGNTVFTSGAHRFVEIIAPALVCGDGYCQIYESNESCPADCPTPPPPPPENKTEPGGGGGAGGGAGGGGGGGAAGGFVPQKECKEKWLCLEWGVCMPTSLRNRQCIDENNCGTISERPELEQACIYLPTCFDGIQNQGELGVDCGGPCLSCQCLDGVQNGNETGVDCGGPCPACPSCFDRIMNCHKLENGTTECEQGVDCGGPCPACAKPKIEMPLRICIRVIDPFNIYFQIFLLVVAAFVSARVYFYRRRIQKIKADTEIESFKRAKLAYDVQRKMYLFLVSCFVVMLILLFYYYFFGICKTDNIKYLWLLGVMLVLAPVLIHRIMKYFEYNEKDKIRKLAALSDSHYRHIMNLINIENAQIMELENEIAEKINALSKDDEFREIIEKEEALKRIYKDILRLYDEYKHHKNPYEEEKLLCTEIYEIEKDKHFAELAAKHPEVDSIQKKLKILYQHYEEKQELYDELDKMEEGEEPKQKTKPQENAEQAEKLEEQEKAAEHTKEVDSKDKAVEEFFKS